MVLCVCPNPSVDKYVWVDEFEFARTNRAIKEKNFPGGKGVHVALALKELQEDPVILGFWGGPTGMWIRDECNMKGIGSTGPVTKEWTRTCITFKSDGRLNDTELLGAGPEITSSEFEAFVGVFKDALDQASCVTMSGSWPKGAPEDAYAQLIKLATQSGKMTFLDCSGTQLKNALSQNPYLVHINQHEGKNYFGSTRPDEMAVALSGHCSVAAVTAGADGLFLRNNVRGVHSVCRIEKVYSAVGSGDCLLAGLTYACLHGKDIVESARMGAACGAANCLREDLGMLYQSDVCKLTKKTDVSEL